jgi:hypothetical protein
VHQEHYNSSNRQRGGRQLFAHFVFFNPSFSCFYCFNPSHIAQADFISKFRIGLRQRTTSMCEFGPLKDRSSAVMCVCLTQDVQDPTDPDNASALIVSRIYFVDTPGAERLALDPTSLRIKEGPTLNKSLIGLGSLIKTLANPNDSPFAEYGHCVLTTLLQVATRCTRVML